MIGRHRVSRMKDATCVAHCGGNLDRVVLLSSISLVAQSAMVAMSSPQLQDVPHGESSSPVLARLNSPWWSTGRSWRPLTRSEFVRRGTGVPVRIPSQDRCRSNVQLWL